MAGGLRYAPMSSSNARMSLHEQSPLTRVLLGFLLTTTFTGACAHGSAPAPVGGASTAAVELLAGGGTGGDGTPARQARLVEPFGVARDASGELYIVEHTGHRLRKVDKDGILRTVAGTGEKGDGGDDGPAL